MDIDIPKDWLELLESEIEKPYFQSLLGEIDKSYQEKVVYPAKKNIFRAFELTPLHKVKVVILGQDPYHGPNQAHGLAFSVPKGIAVPPSLRNIYKELQSDLSIAPRKAGDLTDWAEQGVLLLNTTLTVEANQAGSHYGRGWETFTDRIIELISKEKESVVFILWGKNAINKESLIDNDKHLVIKSPHPSPLSAHRGFFGSQPFSRANQWLKEKNLETINW